MVLVKGPTLKPLYAHCLGGGPKPRVTVTTHPAADGEWVWYLGGDLAEAEGVAFMVADMAVEVDAMRVMVWRACARAEQGLSFQREAYLARLLCSEKAMKIGTDAVQLLGGHGFTKEHPVERWYRDLRALAIMAGGLQL
jgi:hypothetical protein